MNIYLAAVVIFVTFLVAYWFGYRVNHGAAELERVRLLAELDEATANVQLPRAGRLANQGAQDLAYQMRRIAAPGAAGPQHLSPDARDGTAASPAMQPIPWDLAGAAYVLGQVRADQDAVSREVNAIFAEIEGNPAKWRHG